MCVYVCVHRNIHICFPQYHDTPVRVPTVITPCTCKFNNKNHLWRISRDYDPALSYKSLCYVEYYVSRQDNDTTDGVKKNICNKEHCSANNVPAEGGYVWTGTFHSYNFRWSMMVGPFMVFKYHLSGINLVPFLWYGVLHMRCWTVESGHKVGAASCLHIGREKRKETDETIHKASKGCFWVSNVGKWQLLRYTCQLEIFE